MNGAKNSGMDGDGGGSPAYVFLLASVAALGGLLFGYDTAVISGAIGFIREHWSLDPHMEGWAASSALVGCIAGAAFAGVLSDAIGRKKALLLSAVLFTVSAVASALPQNVAQLAVARIIGGLGVGAASMLSPLYIAEVSPARIRGRMVSINQFAIVFGMLVVYFVNYFIAARGESAGGAQWNVELGWRWMFASETLPALLFFALLFLVPESPRWLIKRNRGGEALAVLSRVGGVAAARAEAASIADAVAHEDSSPAQLLQPGLRLAVLIGIVLAVLQQVTGINVVLYYAPKIFESMGLSATGAIFQTILVGAVNMGFTLVAIWVVDRVGRKPLLLAASAGMGLCLCGLGVSHSLGRMHGALPLLLVLAYVASFAVAMGPVVWVVLSEIYPTRVRGTAMSVATVCLWIACYAVSQTFPWLLATFSGNSFYLYAVMCAASLAFVWRFIPETKGRTLEEIERQWTVDN